MLRGRFTAGSPCSTGRRRWLSISGAPSWRPDSRRASRRSFVGQSAAGPRGARTVPVYLDLVGDDRQAQVMVLLAIGGLEAMTGRDDSGDGHSRPPRRSSTTSVWWSRSVPRRTRSTWPTRSSLAGDPARVVDLLRASCATLERLDLPILLATPRAAHGPDPARPRAARRGRALRDLGSGHGDPGRHRRARALAERHVRSSLDPGTARRGDRVSPRSRSPIMAASELVDSRAHGQMVLATGAARRRATRPERSRPPGRPSRSRSRRANETATQGDHGVPRRRPPGR